MERVGQAGTTTIVPETEAPPGSSGAAEAPALLPLPVSQAGFGVEIAMLWVLSCQGDREARRDESRAEEQAMLRAGRNRIAELREQTRAAWRAEIVRGVGGIAAGGLQVVGACCPAGGPRSGGDTEASGSEVAAATGDATDASGATDTAPPTFEGPDDDVGVAAEVAAEPVTDPARAAREAPVEPAAEARKVDLRALLTGGARLPEATGTLWGGYHDQRAGEHGAAAEGHGLAQEIAQRHAARSRDAQADANDDVTRTIELIREMLAATNAAQGAAILRG